MPGNSSALLLTAGLAGGIVNALAGGATLITFPAMLAAGLPPVLANASNAVAISPGHLVAAFADRERLPKLSPRLFLFMLAAMGGGLGGAALLMILPERLFIKPVPALIGFATLLFYLAPRIQPATRNHDDAGQSLEAPQAIALLTLVSVYGGFFGAGLGIMLTAVLSITEAADLRAIKALKNLLASAVSVTAIATFILKSAVCWPQTLTMMTGALFGGFVGGRLIRTLPSEYVRRVVILAGTILTVIYAARYWF